MLDQRRRRHGLSVVGWLLLALLPAPAAATTYCVNGDTGNDDNSGIAVAGVCSDANAWRTIPGTRNVGGTAFLSGGSWGNVSGGAAVIGCADTVLLKGGTSQQGTADNAGSVQIDSLYWQGNCAGAPKRLRVASGSEWSGSTGGYTLDGTGVSVYVGCINCYTSATEAALLNIGISKFTAGGISDAQPLRIVNALGNGIQVAGTGTRLTDTDIQYLVMQNIGLTVSSGRQAIGIARADNTLIRNFTIDNVGWAAVNVGLNSDANRCSFVLRDFLITRTGMTAGDPNRTDALFINDSNGFIINGRIEQSGARGANFGTIGAHVTYDPRVRLRNVAFIDAGQRCSGSPQLLASTCTGLHTPSYCCTGPGTHNCIYIPPFTSCAGAGLDFSGDEDLTGSHARATGFGLVSFHNGMWGFGLYAGGQLDLWHSIAYANGWDRPDGADFLWDVSAGSLQLHNSIQQRAFRRAFGYGTSGGSGAPPPVIDYSILRPGSTDTDSYSDFSFTGGTTFVTSGKNYSQGLGVEGTTWLHTLANAIGWVTASTSSYDANDFHLTAGSAAINAGKCIFKTTGSGTAATTVIPVTKTDANQLSDNPQDYPFVGADSHYKASEYNDSTRLLYVEGCANPLTIQTVNATNIVTTACGGSGFAANACVHPYEYVGANAPPEIGPKPYDATAPTPTSTTQATATATPTPTVTATSTPVVTVTPTRTATPTPTAATPTPTATSTVLFPTPRDSGGIRRGHYGAGWGSLPP